MRPTILIGKPSNSNNTSMLFPSGKINKDKANYTPFPPSGVIPFKGKFNSIITLIRYNRNFSIMCAILLLYY